MEKMNLSIIIYSVESTEKLTRTLRSITGQQNITNIAYELFCIEREKTDKSYAESMPDLPSHSHIIVSSTASQYNGIVEAINCAQGKYIAFLQAGDEWEKTALSKVMPEVAAEKYDLICMQRISQKRAFAISKALNNKNAEIYNGEEYNFLPSQLSGCFISKKRLSENLYHFWEKSLVPGLLSAVIKPETSCCNMKYAVLTYERDAHADDIPLKSNGYLNDFISHAGSERNIIRQHYALQEILKYLQAINQKEHYPQFADDSLKTFLSSVLSGISAEIIDNSNNIISQFKMYFYALKWGIEYLQKSTFTDNSLCYDGHCIFNFHNSDNLQLIIMESKENVLYLEGTDVFGLLGDEWELFIADDNGKEYKAQNYQWPRLDKIGFWGEKIYAGRRFCFEIPLNNIYELGFFIRKSGEKLQIKLAPTFGVYAKLANNVSSYYAKDNFIFRYRHKTITITNNTLKSRMLCELKMCGYLLRHKRPKIIVIRMLYIICKIFCKKPIWIIRDAEKRAKDNGAEFFKFYSTLDDTKYANAYFVLDKNSEDYDNLKKYGKIVQPYSLKYKILHLLSAKVIDSRGGISSKYVFGKSEKYVRDLCQWDYIWLIHGIMTRNESTWTNKFLFNAKVFATCSHTEYESVIDPQSGYGYTENEVKITGLPRHDSLYANKQKKILFLPTWRKHLAGDIKGGTSERAYVKDFRNNEFHRFYNSLINHPKLLETMKRCGYTGDFYLHPSFIKQCNDFDGNELISIGKAAADTNKLIGECSLLITDYSSAQFEGAYLDLPVIYTQYDADSFSELHTGKEGYFDYEKDGFGPVCYTLEESVDAICRYIENDCKNIAPYVDRCKTFFAYRDHNNSRRVFEEILKIDGYYVDGSGKLKKIKSPFLENVQDTDDQSSCSCTYYNSHYNIKSYFTKIKITDGHLKLCGEVLFPRSCEIKDTFEFTIQIGDDSYPLKVKKRKGTRGNWRIIFQTHIACSVLSCPKQSSSIYLRFQDEQGFGYCGSIKYRFVRNLTVLREKKNRKFHFSKPYIFPDGETTIFIRETEAGNAIFVMRETSKTDFPAMRAKINAAYFCSKLPFNSKSKRATVFFEKFSSKYEESASVLFERLIDKHTPNVFFIIDSRSPYLQNIAPKYRPFIVYKYSFEHYLLLFSAKTFIATESMNHAVEINVANRKIFSHIRRGAYQYVFLQHGVMYMYSLENRNDFVKGKGFQKYSKVVVSSEKEADHFIKYGNFNKNDLIVSGLPKFDRAVKNATADKILIMPTSRDFEYNVMRMNPLDSTYYKFVSNIIKNVPTELQEKVVFVAHPLIKEQMCKTDLISFMPEEIEYDKLLRDTALLITDYSSISYDAFYRGSNVIFCWEDKEMCLNSMNYKLMLDEGSAFGDISKDFNDIGKLIKQNYLQEQRPEHIAKYREIVAYCDNRNTERCYNYLQDNGYLSCKTKRKNISGVKFAGSLKKIYNKHRRRHNDLLLTLGERELIPLRDYTQYYFNNRLRGKNALLIVVGKGDYKGIVIRRFRISKDINSCSVYGLCWDDRKGILDASKLTLKDGKKYLRREKDFTVSDIDCNIHLNSGDEYVKISLQGKEKYGREKVLYIKKNKAITE